MKEETEDMLIALYLMKVSEGREKIVDMNKFDKMLKLAKEIRKKMKEKGGRSDGKG